MSERQAPVLILPGLYDSGPKHWQTLWEKSQQGCERVILADWARPALVDWVNTLEAAIIPRRAR